MSTASPLGQPAFDICGALATNGLDASAHDNGTHPAIHCNVHSASSPRNALLTRRWSAT
jgi:hypothetical protein